MLKSILIALALVPGILNAQPDPNHFVNGNFPDSPEQKNLYNSVMLSPVSYGLQPMLADFITKAQKGLDFMCPGSRISGLKFEVITDWSESSSLAFGDYVRYLRKDDIQNLPSGWVENEINRLRRSGARFAIMSWKIVNDFGERQINSVALMDNDWNVMFDSELVKFATGISNVNVSSSEEEADNNSPGSVSVITNQRTGNITFNYVVEGTFGSVRHYNYVRATAVVPPYITAATNDAFFSGQTTDISVERRDIDPLAPPTDPCIYFGTGGTIANSYSSAVPFRSRVYLTGSDDRFTEGIYHVSGDNGHSWSFTFDFSVSAGPVGLGITPQQNTPDFTLTSPSFSEVRVNNHVYYYLLGNTYRALFYDGGSLQVNNFNIMTRNSESEVGAVNFSLPLQVAYWSYLILYPYSFTGVTLNLSNVQYLRGDHVRQPTYTLTSTNHNMAIGDVDTIKATVRNNSSQVRLKGGSISINVASLSDRLTLLSPATLQIDSVNTNSSKTYNFIVRATSNGVVTPQVNISSVGWTWPVPPDVVINNIFSIDSNITVGNVGISTVSNELPADYSMSQNYPNPFNPTTNIEFAIPKNGHVKIRIYDITGKMITELVNTELSAGYYKADFNGSSLPSGVYIYRIEANDFSRVKKMTLVK